MRKLFFFLLILVIFSACSNQPKWARYELYFGRSFDNGEQIITDEDWDTFLEESIVPAFQDGFTIMDAKGYWKDDDKTYHEPSNILMVVALDNIETESKIMDIATTYVERFKQNSVLHIKSSADVRFYSTQK